jgi:hypothetical protein
MDTNIKINLSGYKCVGNYWDDNLWYHPIIQIIIVFIISFILSYFSLGFFFFLLIFIVLELYFAYRIGFMYTLEILTIRSSIFIAGLSGFLLGRLYLVGDCNPFRHSYHEFI